jgi:hypothetical protein
MRVDGQWAIRTEKERITIRRRFCHCGGADAAALARLIVDDKTFTQSRGQALAENPPDTIGSGPRRKSDDYRHDFTGIIGCRVLRLSECSGARVKQNKGCEDTSFPNAHVVSSLRFYFWFMRLLLGLLLSNRFAAMTSTGLAGASDAVLFCALAS